MTFWSMLMVKVNDSQAEAAAQEWIRRRCIEEAAETIPGFRHGEILLSTDERERLCVLCSWEDETFYKEWLNSPVRAKQFTDLSGRVSADVETLCFRSVHAVPKG